MHMGRFHCFQILKFSMLDTFEIGDAEMDRLCIWDVFMCLDRQAFEMSITLKLHVSMFETCALSEIYEFGFLYVCCSMCMFKIS